MSMGHLRRGRRSGSWS